MLVTAGKDHTDLTGVFEDLPFPAARWAIAIHAQDFGVDRTMLNRIWELPPEGASSAAVLVRWLLARRGSY